jgi:penicillin amidase
MLRSNKSIYPAFGHYASVTPVKLRRVVRLGAVGVLAFILFGCALLAVLWWCLRASLPQLDGEVRLTGLTAPVRITRDALGVPTVQATNRVDAARALGFVHAQERFFQMDLLRRSGAGELAELFGQQLVAHDEAVRRRQ